MWYFFCRVRERKGEGEGGRREVKGGENNLQLFKEVLGVDVFSFGRASD
jgi:hypothetical protein